MKHAFHDDPHHDFMIFREEEIKLYFSDCDHEVNDDDRTDQINE